MRRGLRLVFNCNAELPRGRAGQLVIVPQARDERLLLVFDGLQVGLRAQLLAFKRQHPVIFVADGAVVFRAQAFKLRAARGIAFKRRRLFRPLLLTRLKGQAQRLDLRAALRVARIERRKLRRAPSRVRGGGRQRRAQFRRCLVAAGASLPQQCA